MVASLRADAWLSCTVSLFSQALSAFRWLGEHRAESRNKDAPKGLRAPTNMNYRMSPNSVEEQDPFLRRIPQMLFPLTDAFNVTSSVSLTHTLSFYWHPFHTIWYFITYYFKSVLVDCRMCVFSANGVVSTSKEAAEISTAFSAYYWLNTYPVAWFPISKWVLMWFFYFYRRTVVLAFCLGTVGPKGEQRDLQLLSRKYLGSIGRKINSFWLKNKGFG